MLADLTEEEVRSLIPIDEAMFSEWEEWSALYWQQKALRDLATFAVLKTRPASDLLLTRANVFSLLAVSEAVRESNFKFNAELQQELLLRIATSIESIANDILDMRLDQEVSN